MKIQDSRQFTLASRPGWRQALASAVRDTGELADMLGLPEPFRASAHAASPSFPLLAPREFVARMISGDPDDPLLRQVLPLTVEERPTQGFTEDPLRERRARRAPGLLQKYPGRALLITTGQCAMHCRYCFRRHYPYAEGPVSIEEWQPALDAITADASLHEIILSGGDPLYLEDDWLSRMSDALAAIPHLRRLRVHTRLPVAIPQRVNDELIGWLTGSRLTPILVVQVNHSRKLEGECAEALRKLVRSGVTVLNQSVLLRGVNDSAEALVGLCEGLIDLGVVPYYLHQLDPVSGAAHFEVSVEEGMDLIRAIRRRLPGYAVPTYVREAPGEAHKQPLI